MAILTNKLLEAYQYYNYEMMDPRSRDCFYVNSPWVCMIIIALYLKFVNSWGPKFMSERPAYKLDGIIRIYNIAQILMNLYIFIGCVQVVTDEKFNWRCMPVIYDDSQYALKVLWLAHLFFWIKVTDLLDTVFFILRKKHSQVSFLHVYHHAIMPFCLWIGVKYYPGGNPIMVGLLNSLVHVVMYSYYLLTSINSEYKKSVWWKKHLTQLQLVQFFIISTHTGQMFFHNPCGYPMFLAAILVIQNMFMVVLFSDFYRKAYIKKKTA